MSILDSAVFLKVPPRYLSISKQKQTNKTKPVREYKEEKVEERNGRTLQYLTVKAITEDIMLRS